MKASKRLQWSYIGVLLLFTLMFSYVTCEMVLPAPPGEEVAHVP